MPLGGAALVSGNIAESFQDAKVAEVIMKLLMLADRLLLNYYKNTIAKIKR